jgi:hypothetical protein
MFGVSRVVHIGDEVDNHALSYHEKDPDGNVGGREAELAQAGMNKWYKEFHNVNVCVGNHSALPFRKAYTHGIPKRFMKAYEDIWEAPKGWKWELDWEFDGVLYTHGLGASGQNGAIKKAKENRQSTVIGHIHSFGGVNYSACDRDMIFALNVGCGIDITSYSMTYARPFSQRPTLGAGIVIDGKIGLFIPMDLGSKLKWKK